MVLMVPVCSVHNVVQQQTGQQKLLKGVGIVLFLFVIDGYLNLANTSSDNSFLVAGIPSLFRRLCLTAARFENFMFARNKGVCF